MGSWHFNPGEPCCNPATAVEIDPVTQQGSARCGNCRHVPRIWKLSVPAGTILAPEPTAQLLNGEHILRRVGEHRTDFLPGSCVWNVIEDPVLGIGWELGFDLELEQAFRDRWTISTLPRGFTPGPDSIATHSIWLLIAGGSVVKPLFRCDRRNLFDPNDVRPTDVLTIDPTQQLTIEPWYP